MNYLRLLILMIIPLILLACNGGTKTIALGEQMSNDSLEVDLNEIVIMPDTRSYRSSETRINDLLHSKLEVSFDWKNRHVLGVAQLQLKPYFYPTSELTLDAKGMEIHSVELLSDGVSMPIDFTYDSKFIVIQLDRTYNREESYSVKIAYTAKPEEIEAQGSIAIAGANGLYFINPDSLENKPTQIWTQGETESNSCWFPTIDSPNERMTQELAITIDEKYKSLSNGELMFQNYNGDGTRTDYWQQMKPHAPYLVMMAIGDFKVIGDEWKRGDEDLLVDYYMEPEFAPYADAIFGNTPEMLSFYSEVLGFPYPWDKYSQVIVRDFVSGAMENTSATLHGAFLNATERELLDGDNEDVIAHELFHHWFGDLVTCESWSNLPLNESFATYGEYLWIEHKYGREAADLHGFNSQNGYLAESGRKQENLIRFKYDDKDDMFDGHSYNKGGRVLHMLRYFLGDDAFFTGLNVYLTEHQFESVEIHQLRLAMEEVSGKDLNWFFNQWFLGSGHPDLEIKYTSTEGSLSIDVNQLQSKLFRLPLYVDIVTEAGRYRERIDIRKQNQTFDFVLNSPIVYANVDADNVLLGTKTEDKPQAWWALQYENSSLYLDRHYALGKAIELGDSSVVIKALNDSFWKIREEAIDGTKALSLSHSALQSLLEETATSDNKSAVRSSALEALKLLFTDNHLTSVYTNALSDSSYMVMASGLEGLATLDADLALEKAKELESETNSSVNQSIASIYANYGNASHNTYLVNNLANTSDYERYGFLASYASYLGSRDIGLIKANYSIIEKEITEDGAWWMTLAGYDSLSILYKALESRGDDDAEAAALAAQIKAKVEDYKSKEIDANVLFYLSNDKE